MKNNLPNQPAKILLAFTVILATLLAILVLPATPGHAADAGYALRFDGTSDFIDLNQTGLIFPGGWQTTKSVSLWVKPAGESPQCYNDNPAWCDVIFGDRPTSWGIARGIINGQDRIWAWNFDASGNGLDMVGIQYYPDEWVNVTLVHANGVLKIYRYGVLYGSIASGATQQADLSGETPRLNIGGAITTDLRNLTFEGDIDEVRVYSTELTAADIQAGLQDELNGDEPGLVAYYKMSDGSGLSLTDDSGHGWTGTFKDGNIGVPGNGEFAQWVASDAFNFTIPTIENTATQTFTRTRNPTYTETLIPTQTFTRTATRTRTATFTATPTILPSGTLVTPADSGGSSDQYVYLPLVTR